MVSGLVNLNTLIAFRRMAALTLQFASATLECLPIAGELDRETHG